MLARVALCLPAAGWDSASGLTAVTGRPEACGAKLTAPPPRVAAVIESAAKLPAADGPDGIAATAGGGGGSGGFSQSCARCSVTR